MTLRDNCLNFKTKTTPNTSVEAYVKYLYGHVEKNIKFAFLGNTTGKKSFTTSIET